MAEDAYWYEAAFVVGITNALNVVADVAPELASVLPPDRGHRCARRCPGDLPRIRAFYARPDVPPAVPDRWPDLVTSAIDLGARTGRFQTTSWRGDFTRFVAFAVWSRHDRGSAPRSTAGSFGGSASRTAGSSRCLASPRCSPATRRSQTRSSSSRTWPISGLSMYHRLLEGRSDLVSVAKPRTINLAHHLAISIGRQTSEAASAGTPPKSRRPAFAPAQHRATKAVRGHRPEGPPAEPRDIPEPRTRHGDVFC